MASARFPKARRKSYGLKITKCKKLSLAKVKAIAKRHHVGLRHKSSGKLKTKLQLCRQIKEKSAYKGRARAYRKGHYSRRRRKRTLSKRRTPRRKSSKRKTKMIFKKPATLKRATIVMTPAPVFVRPKRLRRSPQRLITQF